MFHLFVYIYAFIYLFVLTVWLTILSLNQSSKYSMLVQKEKQDLLNSLYYITVFTSTFQCKLLFDRNAWRIIIVLVWHNNRLTPLTVDPLKASLIWKHYG